ncbi:hypothetical protein ES708_02978 [subsurface metagenome]
MKIYRELEYMKKRFLPILLFVMILPLAAAGGVCGAESPLQTTSKGPLIYFSKKRTI